LGELVKIEPELLKLGYQIIAVSADSPEFLSQSDKKHKPNYLLLSDSSMQGAKALGIAWQVTADTYKKYQSFGIDLEKVSGKTHHLLPVPAAYIINTDAVIKFAYTNPDHRIRINPGVLLAAAKAEADNE
jgi:peroxiredoxin